MSSRRATSARAIPNPRASGATASDLNRTLELFKSANADNQSARTFCSQKSFDERPRNVFHRQVNPRRFVKTGDVIRIEIQNVGILENTVGE